jgi:hypothetical protein
MRKTLLVFTLIILFVMSGTSAAVLAFVEIAPFAPEEKLFPIQDELEHALIVFYPHPTSKSWYELKILDKRVMDLEETAGQSEEVSRISTVWVEIDHVLKQFQADNPHQDKNLRFRFVKILSRIQTRMDELTYLAENYPLKYVQAKEKINQLKILVLDDSVLLSDLFILSNSSMTANFKASSINNLGVAVKPHKIPFLPGSNGADHEFFPLMGKHAELSCEGCHSDITYAGLPNQCVECHSVVLPENHYNGLCSLCHTPAGWIPADFDHSVASAEDCQSCHMVNKPANHYSGQCSSCHTSIAWIPASFNHAVAGASDCQSCHSGRKPANHFSGQCSACHSTSAWKPANFNHAVAGASDCQSCHSGKKPANHFSGQCSACHSTSAWKPASFNHTAAGATDCQSCHSGNKPNNHFSGQCSSCHNTDSWKGASFSHRFPMNHGKANGECAQCHPSGGSSWTCFNCHDQAKMTKKHEEKGIPDYVVRCMECHSDGKD